MTQWRVTLLIDGSVKSSVKKVLSNVGVNPNKNKNFNVVILPCFAILADWQSLYNWSQPWHTHVQYPVFAKVPY